MPIEFKHILVPIDFGEPSQKALEAATELALRFGAQLTLLHVYERPVYIYAGVTYATTDLFGPIEEAAREQLERTLREVQAKVPAAIALLGRGVPATEILKAVAEVQPDLVVMGTHGRRGVGRALFGSVAEKVVRLSPVPVLTFREKTEARPGETARA
jgi:nucleotide-binding universal stress UspA family protein